MKTKLFTFLAVFATLFVTSCKDDDTPAVENETEVIDKITLNFKGDDESLATATATDPDGKGPQNFKPDGEIPLRENVKYTLTITLENTTENKDMTTEIKNEADEHMFFFEFTNDIFSTPAGDGNIDKRADAIVYKDKDKNNLPLGLETEWTTTGAKEGSKFRIVLKHQPKVKSATSTFSDGSTDLDVEFTMSFQ